MGLVDGGAALVIALLLARGQQVLYIPGRTVNRATAGYRGEGKTDARDAHVIAYQARMRRDLQPITATDEGVLELRFLTARRLTWFATVLGPSTGSAVCSAASSLPSSEAWSWRTTAL
ncbi:hypothetical protein EH183_26795 [Streptomyces sp. CB01881]|nr:hypothetical protein C2142_26815 [Streptomyces sp. CB01881]TYC71982.1 hypothetical protein EH183_26795 [Streptomyces sp. CB01881]